MAQLGLIQGRQDDRGAIVGLGPGQRLAELQGGVGADDGVSSAVEVDLGFAPPGARGVEADDQRLVPVLPVFPADSFDLEAELVGRQGEGGHQGDSSSTFQLPGQASRCRPSPSFSSAASLAISPPSPRGDLARPSWIAFQVLVLSRRSGAFVRPGRVASASGAEAGSLASGACFEVRPQGDDVFVGLQGLSQRLQQGPGIGRPIARRAARRRRTGPTSGSSEGLTDVGRRSPGSCPSRRPRCPGRVPTSWSTARVASLPASPAISASTARAVRQRGACLDLRLRDAQAGQRLADLLRDSTVRGLAGRPRPQLPDLAGQDGDVGGRQDRRVEAADPEDLPGPAPGLVPFVLGGQRLELQLGLVGQVVQGRA